MQPQTSPPAADRELARIGPRQLKDPGSVEFAWQTVARMKTLWQSREISAERWRQIVAEADQHRIYDRVPPENPYGSLDALLVQEIGETVLGSFVKAELRAKSGRPPKGQAPNPYNIRNRGEFGTNATYLRARLQRDRPDLVTRLDAGEFRSVRQAAIEAGIVKVPTILEQLRKLWQKATPEERATFTAEVR